MVYNLLDQYLLGGTQWGWTANWSSELKDGWNRENFSITDVRRNMRSNYAIRPFPRATAGIPGNFSASPRPHMLAQACVLAVSGPPVPSRWSCDCAPIPCMVCNEVCRPGLS